MLYRMTKGSGSCYKLNKTKNIKSKVSKRHSYYSIDSSISDYDSPLSSDSESYEIGHPTENK